MSAIEKQIMESILKIINFCFWEYNSIKFKNYFAIPNTEIFVSVCDDWDQSSGNTFHNCRVIVIYTVSLMNVFFGLAWPIPERGWLLATVRKQQPPPLDSLTQPPPLDSLTGTGSHSFSPRLRSLVGSDPWKTGIPHIFYLSLAFLSPSVRSAMKSLSAGAHSYRKGTSKSHETTVVFQDFQ